MRRGTRSQYFAEGVEDWFDTSPDVSPPNGVHNEINTREELQAYDPNLASLVKEAMPNDGWRPEVSLRVTLSLCRRHGATKHSARLVTSRPPRRSRTTKWNATTSPPAATVAAAGGSHFTVTSASGRVSVAKIAAYEDSNLPAVVKFEICSSSSCGRGRVRRA